MCLLLYYKLATHDNTSVINVSMIMSILGWKENHSWWCLLGLVHDSPEGSVIFILLSRFTPQPHSGCLVCSRSKRKPPKGCVLFAYFCPKPTHQGVNDSSCHSPPKRVFVCWNAAPTRVRLLAAKQPQMGCVLLVIFGTKRVRFVCLFLSKTSPTRG